MLTRPSPRYAGEQFRSKIVSAGFLPRSILPSGRSRCKRHKKRTVSGQIESQFSFFSLPPFSPLFLDSRQTGEVTRKMWEASTELIISRKPGIDIFFIYILREHNELPFGGSCRHVISGRYFNFRPRERLPEKNELAREMGAPNFSPAFESFNIVRCI